MRTISKRLYRRPSPATVISIVALFVAISGTAMALPGTNSVNSGDIINRQVKTQDLHGDAVNTGKIADQQVRRADLRDSVVNSSKVLDESLASSDLGADAVGSSEIAGTTDGIATQTVPANSTLNATATCPAGGQAISGGYFTPATGVVQVTRMRRDSDNSWAFTFRNTAATGQAVDARVTCLVG